MQEEVIDITFELPDGSEIEEKVCGFCEFPTLI